MKLRLTIDARWLVGGIGTYTRHLLEGLQKHRKNFEVHAITQGKHAEELKPCCAQVTVVDVPIYTAREQWAIPRAARGCDVLHVPHYDAPLFGSGPLVITIHDIIHITDPDYRASLKAWAYAWPVLKRVGQRAERIITDSNFSRTQIIERLDVPASKVCAIPCGVSGDFRPMDQKEAFLRVSAALGIRRPYLLYVGNLKRHKNVSTLLKAFAQLRPRQDFPQHLLVVGDDAQGKRELAAECAPLGISARVDFVPYVAPELLPKVYAAADALVMPSRLEGFGLPVLEAMACGTPVVCSRAASLPEVGGQAVVYFDPQSPEDLAGAMERVLSSRELRESLRVRGLARAAQFTWESSVDKHVPVYQSVVG